VGLPGGVVGVHVLAQGVASRKERAGGNLCKIMPLSGIRPSPSLSFPLSFSKPGLGCGFRRGVVDQMVRDKRGWRGLGSLNATTNTHTCVCTQCTNMLNQYE
jgi:hypothetical protein